MRQLVNYSKWTVLVYRGKKRTKGRGEYKKLQPPFFILGTTRELVGAKMPPTNVSGVVTLLRAS